MVRAQQTLAMFRMRRARRLGLRLALAAATVMAPAGITAHAAPDADCTAIDQGALNVELESTANATRQVKLRAGDTLTFAFETAAGPFGSLTLLQGTGSPRLLLVGPAGTSVSFVATRRGSFAFQFAREGAEPAAFSVSCTPARGAHRGDTPTVLSTSRRGEKLTAENWTYAEGSEAADSAAVALDPGAAAPQQDNSLPALAPSAAGPSPSAPKQAGSLEMKLRDRRYAAAAGPDGPEIDAAASGVNVGLNYKVLPEIMVGALAQFDQPAETMIGAPRSLSDQGWMAGPVTTVKLAPGLSLDARAAWGLADTSADDVAARNSSAQRRMVSARLANTQSFGAWRFTPSISVNHFQETALAPAPATHETVVPYPAASGRVDIGPELAYRFDLDKSTFIEPRAAIGSFWGIDSLSRLTPGTAHTDMRLKAEAGVTIGATDGPKLQAAGGVEGGDAAGAANVWSGRLQLSVPMR